MQCPKKIYLVVSRKHRGVFDGDDVLFTRADADEEAAERNTRPASWADCADWRVETYVKGD